MMPMIVSVRCPSCKKERNVTADSVEDGLDTKCCRSCGANYTSVMSVVLIDGETAAC